MMDIERQKKFIYQFVYWLIIAGLVYILLKYAMPLLMPFLIAFLVSVILRPLSEWLAKKMKLPRKWVAVVILLLFYAIMGTLLFFSSARLITVIRQWVLSIPDHYRTEIEPAFRILFNDMTAALEELDPSLLSTVQSMTGNVISSLANMVTTFSTVAMNWLSGFVGAIPSFLVSFVIALIASFYATADYPLVKSFILRQLKPRHLQILTMIRDNAVHVLGSYVKAYLKLMSLTFVELLIGLGLIVGLPNAIPAALGIAVFDVFPVLGAGGVLIPWAAIELILGDVGQAVKLMIMYGVVVAVRNIMEPKLVGEQIGLHPLVTLLCMYVGAFQFGFVGFLGLPVTATVLNNLNKNGTIKLFKK